MNVKTPRLETDRLLLREVQELYEALEFYWDNKEEKEEIERKIESMGYFI